jgi:farnesyl diphosphate synthase
MDGARHECRQIVARAESALDGFGSQAQILREAVRFVVERQV